MTRQRSWTVVQQKAFLDYLMMHFDVDQAARAIGVDPVSAWHLRSRNAGFAAQWAAARRAAYDVIEAALLARAIGGPAGVSAEGDSDTGTAALRRDLFDPALALKLLARQDAAHRAAESRAGAAVARTRGMNAAVPIAQVQAELLKRIGMIERRSVQNGVSGEMVVTVELAPQDAPGEVADIAERLVDETPA